MFVKNSPWTENLILYLIFSRQLDLKKKVCLQKKDVPGEETNNKESWETDT